jgi:tRNA threonylcarbamoyladenosine biosynthesis protein TsaB
MILAIKTSDATAQLRLYKPGNSEVFAEEFWESGRALADELLPRLEGFLKSHKHDWKDLSGIVIYSGPGSFTSLRIGHTVANALADSLHIPIIGATGDDWATTGLDDLAATPPARPALPHYGADAHITPPTKPESHQE